VRKTLTQTQDSDAPLILEDRLKIATQELNQTQVQEQAQVLLILEVLSQILAALGGREQKAL
jgi:hypothetical protein